VREKEQYSFVTMILRDGCLSLSLSLAFSLSFSLSLLCSLCLIFYASFTLFLSFSPSLSRSLCGSFFRSFFVLSYLLSRFIGSLAPTLSLPLAPPLAFCSFVSLARSLSQRETEQDEQRNRDGTEVFEKERQIVFDHPFSLCERDFIQFFSQICFNFSRRIL